MAVRLRGEVEIFTERFHSRVIKDQIFLHP